MLETSVRNAFKIIILEGNYLLLNEDGWRELADFADYTISIGADPDMLKERLIERKIATGCPEDEAVAFVDFSDMANVELCLEKTGLAVKTQLVRRFRISERE